MKTRALYLSILKKEEKLSKTIWPMYEIFNNLTRYTKDADKAKTERTRYSKYVTK